MGSRGSDVYTFGSSTLRLWEFDTPFVDIMPSMVGRVGCASLFTRLLDRKMFDGNYLARHSIHPRGSAVGDVGQRLSVAGYGKPGGWPRPTEMRYGHSFVTNEGLGLFSRDSASVEGRGNT